MKEEKEKIGVKITRTIFKAHTDDKREVLIKKFVALCQKHHNDTLGMLPR
jgi:hypothetical protein